MNRILIGRTHRKFIAVQVAYDDGILIQQALNGCCIVNGCIALQDARCSPYMMIFIAEYIFDADNDTVEFAPGVWVVLFLVKGLGP